MDGRFMKCNDHNSLSDKYNLSRFVTAQDAVYEGVLAEIRQGMKRSHWMWFVFPQIDGLGQSSTARFYAIKDADEATAYLNHPVLGERLRECCRALLALEGRTASEIFGFPDDLKLKSSMTLFAEVASDSVIFRNVLEKYYAGTKDERTLELLANTG
jgi:uncharacterized protein (DUF1810 family)